MTRKEEMEQNTTVLNYSLEIREDRADLSKLFLQEKILYEYDCDMEEELKEFEKHNIVKRRYLQSNFINKKLIPSNDTEPQQ